MTLTVDETQQNETELARQRTLAYRQAKTLPHVWSPKPGTGRQGQLRHVRDTVDDSLGSARHTLMESANEEMNSLVRWVHGTRRAGERRRLQQ